VHRPRTNQDWWPDQLDLSVLHQHGSKGNPLGKGFGYAEQFAKLDGSLLAYCATRLKGRLRRSCAQGCAGATTGHT
jgi:catalase (peroxidase I)